MKQPFQKVLKYIIVFTIIFLQSQGNTQESEKLEALDIFNLEYVSDPQISPNGEQIIYVRNFKDIMTDRNLSNLWITQFDGSNHRPLTTGNQSDFAPRWSHDGQKLVYKSNKDGKVQLYLRWLDSGMETKLTNSIHPMGNVDWSHNDQYLAFNMFVPKIAESPIKLPQKPAGAKWNDPPIFINKLKYRSDGQGYVEEGNFQLFTLSIEGGTPRQLTDTAFDHGSPSWNADDESLNFSANLKEDGEYEPLNSEIYVIQLNNKKVSVLTNRFGPDQNPVASPDGKMIAYTGFDDEFHGYQVTKLYLMDSDGRNSKCLSCEFDRDINNIHWNSDGTGLYFQYDEFGDSKIGYIDLSGKVTEITKHLGGLSLGRPYNAADFSLSQNNRYAFTFGGTDHPSDLGSGFEGKDQQLTAVNDDLFNYKKLAEVEEIWYESSFDQRKIQGWIVKPPDFDPEKKYPLMLEIHGGPFASYGSVWSAEIQLFASAGYVVLYTNPRGSTGYGKEFGNLIHHNYPGEDYDDLMSGVDAVIERGYIDEHELYVTGGSGGGVLTAWIIGKTNRFKAAVVAKPVINWFSFSLYADNPAFFSKYWFGDFPWNDMENFMRRSPISLVGNVNTPTMLLTGEEDHRTPIAESEQYYSALKLRKIESAMVRIPGASHGLASRPSNLIAKVSSILSWFEKYRLQKP